MSTPKENKTADENISKKPNDDEKQAQEFYSKGEEEEPISLDELNQLTPKNKPTRNPVVSIFVIMLSGYLLLSMSADMSYFFLDLNKK